MIIIGITGTLGAGKGTMSEYLKNKYGFLHFSARDFITKEIEKRNLPVDRDTMTIVANDLREKNHSGYVIEQLYKMAEESGKNSILESVRTVGEIELLKNKKSFYLFAVDAPQKIRYERVLLRKSSTDKISFEKFQSDEKRENESTDPNKQNLSACIKSADYIFQNDLTIKDLENEIDKVLEKIIL